MMDKIKVLIVEDKQLIAENIATRLKKHAFEVVDICASGEEAIAASEEKKPDLILMDIELGGVIDGISAAEIILKKASLPIIYLTDYTDTKTVQRAKKTQPANYLGKPFNEIDLIRAIDLAFHNARTASLRQSPEKQLFLRTDSQVYVKIRSKDILYLQADRAYCDMITTTHTHKFSSSMNHIYEQLDQSDFVKVHRSYIVNVGRITSLDGNMITIEGHNVPMGAEYRDNVFRLIKIIK